VDTPSRYVHPILAQITRGGGEMGALIRAFNWAGSAVGPADSWPQSLRTTLSIILHTKFPMFLFWGKHLTCFYNDAYRPSLGNNGKHPSALGRPGEEVWPEIWADIKPLIDQVLAGGEASWSEDQLLPIYRNGRMEDVYWTFSYSPVMDESGKACAVFVTCSETTQKVRNHLALIESRDQLEFAIESTELGVWDFNPHTNKFKGNDRLKNWFGLNSGSEIELSYAIQTMAEKDRDRVTRAIRHALDYSSGGKYDIDYTIRNPVTGHERMVRAKGRVWFGADQIAYRFNGTLRDVTEEVLAKRQLEEIAERMQLAIGAGNLGTYELVLSTGQITASPKCKLHLGLSEGDDLTLQKLNRLIWPADRPALENAIHGAIRDHTSYNIDYRIRMQDDSVKWIRIAGNPVFNDKGMPVKVVGITVEITELMEFEAELTRQVRERTTELQRSNEDLLQFAHVTSHDLKEPVRKIRIFATRIQEELGRMLPEKGLKYLEKIQHASARITAMIDGVLTYSELNAVEPKIETIDLNKTLEEVQADLEVLIKEKNARITCAPLPIIEGTCILIYQLFYNILNNSLKFSNPHEQPLIVVSCETDAGPDAKARLAIVDNGIGFDNAYQSQIFATFTRLNSKDVYEGTGLGLALCKKIAERHQGSISATGEMEKGATIFVELPVKQNIEIR
jgi:signal transduction histidine kinase